MHLILKKCLPKLQGQILRSRSWKGQKGQKKLIVRNSCLITNQIFRISGIFVELYSFKWRNIILRQTVGINEQTFSRQCWPEPGVCFTFIVLYTSRQNQIPVTMFTKSYNRPGCLWDNSFVQRNSQNTRLYASLASAFLSCRWHQHALFRCGISTVPVQLSLSIAVNGTNFWHP